METISLVRDKRLMTPRAFNQGRTMFIGTLGLFVASLAYVYAVKNTTAANAAFLASVTPLFAVVLARVVLHERLSRVTVAALLLALSGLGVTVVADLGAGNMAGNIAALLSSLGFATYTVCVRSEPSRDWSPILPGYAAVMILVCGVVALGEGRTLKPPMLDLGYALFHGAVLIVLGTIVYNIGSRSVPAVAMTILAQSEMALAPLWVYLKFGEAPTAWALVGGAMILTAIIGKAVLDSRGSARRPDAVVLTGEGAHPHALTETPASGPGFIG
jgi:drug/metabolite transporter (DMT)-like permease